MAQRVDAQGFADALKEPVLLADFYSDSCVPCKRLSPVIAEAEEQHTDIKFVKINVAYDDELAEQYDVSSAPTLILFRNGEEAARSVGFINKDELEEFISR